MRIGLDAVPLTEPKAGIGHYTAELAAELARQSPADDFELILPGRFSLAPEVEAAYGLPGGRSHVGETSGGARPSGDEASPRGGASPRNLRLVRAPAGGVRLRWWSMGLPLCARERGLSIFHGTNYHVPVWDTCPTVVTIHDLSSLLHADTHREELVRRARLRLPAMVRAATVVVTDSEGVRREVCEHFSVSPARVFAVPLAPRRVFRPVPAVESEGVRRRLGVEDEFLLFVGTVEPRKNLPTLVRACAELARGRGRTPQLVIAGGRGWLSDDLHALVEREGLAARTRFTGYLADEDLRALYSSCALAIYPSLYEGFGLPPLEAMSCGAPVVASRIPALEETCGRGAARLVDPLDHRDVARAVAELLADGGARARLSRAGMERAAEYTWERAARRTREVYDEAIERWRYARAASQSGAAAAREGAAAGVA
jgi:glycosyltransferase involved in cell wall biosynthesis